MTAIRNRLELARHNRATDDTLRNHPALATQARQSNAALLAWWRSQPLALREDFNAFFGQPPQA
jgi:hypothetical protein